MTWCCRYASGVAGVSVARVPAWWLEFALVAGGGVDMGEGLVRGGVVSCGLE